MPCPVALFWGLPIKEKRFRSSCTLNFWAQSSVGAFQPQRKDTFGIKGGALNSWVKQHGIRRKVSTTGVAPLDPTKLLKKIRWNLSTAIAKINSCGNFFPNALACPIFHARFMQAQKRVCGMKPLWWIKRYNDHVTLKYYSSCFVFQECCASCFIYNWKKINIEYVVTLCFCIKTVNFTKFSTWSAGV